MKTILVFTGGGLAPALNPTLYGVITAAREQGWRVYGGLSGWASLLPNGSYRDLTNINIEPIKNIGGTFLRSSRTNPFADTDGATKIKKRIAELGIDYIVAIGGDDTLGAASKLAGNGVAIVGIPKTIDNDLHGTYFTPGFPSAAQYLASFAREIKEDAAYALSRIFIIEALGMKAGWLACAGSYGNADIILPPEWPVSWENFLLLLKKRYHENGNFATVIVSQDAKFDIELPAQKYYTKTGEHDEYKHERRDFICLLLREKIKEALGVETKALYPGNYLESGYPTTLDREFGERLGREAVELILQNKIGFAPCIARTDEHDLKLTVASRPLKELVINESSLGQKQYRELPSDYFDINKLFPTQKYFDYMEPILGKYEHQDDDYLKLIKKILA